jgi:CRISPR-associated endonuclease/helicase Cas3
MTYFAHSKPDLPASEWQLLKDHLLKTGDLAFELGRDAEVSDLAKLAGQVHDIGKYSLAFQRRLKGSNQRVDHSSAGAQEIMDLFGKNPALKWPAIILAYCIAGHHTGLLDYGSGIDVEGDGTLMARLNPEKTKLKDYSAYKTEADPAAFAIKSRPIKPILGHQGSRCLF